MIDDFLAELQLGGLRRVMQATLLLLLRLQQNCATSFIQTSDPILVVGNQLRASLSLLHLLRRRHDTRMLHIHVHYFGGGAVAERLVLAALHVVGCGGGLSAITALVVEPLRTGARLPSGAPVGSTHVPCVPMHALIAQRAHLAIHGRHLVPHHAIAGLVVHVLVHNTASVTTGAASGILGVNPERSLVVHWLLLLKMLLVLEMVQVILRCRTCFHDCAATMMVLLLMLVSILC